MPVLAFVTLVRDAAVVESDCEIAYVAWMFGLVGMVCNLVPLYLPCFALWSHEPIPNIQPQTQTYILPVRHPVSALYHNLMLRKMFVAALVVVQCYIVWWGRELTKQIKADSECFALLGGDECNHSHHGRSAWIVDMICSTQTVKGVVRLCVYYGVGNLTTFVLVVAGLVASSGLQGKTLVFTMLGVGGLLLIGFILLTM